MNDASGVAVLVLIGGGLLSFPNIPVGALLLAPPAALERTVDDEHTEVGPNVLPTQSEHFARAKAGGSGAVTQPLAFDAPRDEIPQVLALPRDIDSSAYHRYRVSGIAATVDGQKAALAPATSAGRIVIRIGGVQPDFGEAGQKAVGRERQGIAGFICQDLQPGQGMRCRHIHGSYAGATQAGQMRPTAQSLAKVGGQSAHIGALAAANLEGESVAGLEFVAGGQLQFTGAGPGRRGVPRGARSRRGALCRTSRGWSIRKRR